MRTWYEALKSGEYTQGRGALCDPDGRMCCLGVAVDVLYDGDWELTPDGDWEVDGETYLPPEAWFTETFGVDSCNPIIRLGGSASMTKASSANDNYRLSFSEIADALKRTYDF